ncbi:MAG: histidine kinase [Niabella sp.]
MSNDRPTGITYRRIEFILATLGLGIFVFSLLVSSRDKWFGDSRFEEAGIVFDFYKHVFLPYLCQGLVYYAAFVFLTQFTEVKGNEWSKLGNFLGVYLILSVVISVCNTYTDAWKIPSYKDSDLFYAHCFIDGFSVVAIVMLLYILYYFIKMLLYRLTLPKIDFFQKKRTRLKIAVSLVGSIAIAIIMANSGFHHFFLACWLVAIPYSILAVWYNTEKLIPTLPVKKMRSKYYISRYFPLLLIVNFVAALFFAIIMQEGDDTLFPTYILLLLWMMLVVTPLAWYIYRNRFDKAQLQSALDSSQANLGLLRSQINPHFLFNALNTLYGTALQENAARTGEGIQKLGDMMRFMLHENVQDKISLQREIEYSE